MDDQNNSNPAQDDQKTDITVPATSDAQESPAQPENPFAALKSEETQNNSDDQKIGEPEILTSESADRSDTSEQPEAPSSSDSSEEKTAGPATENSQSEQAEEDQPEEPAKPSNPNARWYVVHTFAGHENKVATALKQRIEAERLENLIFDILVPTQDKIEIRGGKKETVKEKIFPGYILIKMELNDLSWLAVRTTQGVTSFIGAGNKPTPISEAEVATIVKFTSQGAQPTFKDVFMVDDTVKIIDGPFAEFIGKVDSVDKEKGRVRVLVSIFGRETPVELDFLQVQKL